ncbi:hypothetical protein A9K55_002958 [Cordyceps militaris]|uniref:Uncharacterized protein n=1 Tax=Cordyceps militaris TaxID=73501 RepID=A0A2H4S5J7_CORMI|nr:hypothetical protein A9K55_002958 [Cordyceps militaris]
MDGYNGIGKPRNIPLICTVCPESPRFSDVSHLLTHIASKGHLHHETQTKLRAHQDLVSAVALQQYEQWYHENGIETLLVERLKAKQVKEAMKGRLHRANVASKPANVAPRTKKRSRRTTNDPNEYAAQNFAEAIPLYAGLFSEEHDSELPDELLQNNDMLSLKGQIWPGMGKMDLANEDMKRTRNQRKPKSAIDKMRRTSEGIEPTQVVLNSALQVERVKGVYDSSSPIPGQEEATSNETAIHFSRWTEPTQNLPYEHRVMPTVNPISQSASSLTARIVSSKDTFSYDQDSPSGLPDLKHYNFSSSFSHRPDTPNSLNINAFGGASRYTLAMNSHFSAYDRSQGHENHPITPKQEDYFSLAGQTSLLNSSPHFLNVSESNPLLSQDRPFFKSYLQSPSCKGHEQPNSFSFKPINYRPDMTEPTEIMEPQDTSVDDIKVESQLCDIVHPSLHNDNDEATFDVDGTWAADTILDGLPADLGRDGSAV